MNGPLRDLGRKLAQHQDESVADGAVLEHARARLVQSLATRRARKRVTPALAMAATLCAAAALLLVWRAPWHEPAREPTLSFATDGAAPSSGFVDAASTPRILRFSDGSQVTLAPHSALRVLHVHEAGAQVALERGELEVQVAHASDDTRWRFEAGPYRVEVLGTRFRLAWQREDGRFALWMKEGTVHLVGPRVDRMLGAGAAFESNDASTRADHEPSSARNATREQPASDDNPGAAPRSSPVAHVEQAAVDEVAARASTDSTLRTLVRRAAQEEEKDPPEAERLYRRIREQHAGTRAASDAAFMLARFERDPERAAALLETYLHEQPRGRYADAALGRLVRATRKLGQFERARQHAQRYLELYPSGPYAVEAQSLVR